MPQTLARRIKGEGAEWNPVSGVGMLQTLDHAGMLGRRQPHRVGSSGASSRHMCAVLTNRPDQSLRALVLEGCCAHPESMHCPPHQHLEHFPVSRLNFLLSVLKF